MRNYARALYYLESLKRHAYWPNSKLEEHQNKKLRSIVNYAYTHVPFYHRKFKELGITPDLIKTTADLNKLPIIRKKDIKANTAEIVSREFDVKKLRLVSTSGSTGEPLFLYLSNAEMEFRMAKHLRANITIGQKPRDRWVTLVGPQHISKTTPLQRSLGLYVPLTLSVYNDISTQIGLLRELNPSVLDGYSSSLIILAQEFEKRGNKNIQPKFLIGGAELIDIHSRKYVEKVFQVPFYDQYGSVEFERMAWQCPKQQEYHIDADALILQFLDRNGAEVSSGETGEIVCTSLFNYAMPLIRYAIGDMGIPSRETCSCGMKLPLMKMVEGRKDSLLVLPNGQMITPRAFTFAVHEFRFYSSIAKFRIIQKDIENIEFILQLTDHSPTQDIIRTELLKHLRALLNLDSLKFTVTFVDNIPLDKNGKLNIITSQLNTRSITDRTS